jgi:PAS domain S-box-containing protein
VTLFADWAEVLPVRKEDLIVSAEHRYGMLKAKIDILLIHDQQTEADLIIKMLSEYREPEFSVQQVRRLSEGLDLLQSRKFDLVLVDLELPGSQGLEPALSVRRQARRIPIIALSLQADDEASLRSLRLDIQNYLVKGELTGSLLARSIRHAIRRKQTDEKLRESEAKFSRAFHAAPALISISSLGEGRYLDVNEEFIRVLGFSRDAIIGRTSLELGIWEMPGDRELLLRRLRDKQRVRDFETRLRSKDGSIIIGLLSMEIIEIEGAECLLTITRDISDLRKVEEERTRLSLIVESSDDAIIGKTLDGIITSWNKGAQQIYGYSAQEARGRHISMLAPPEAADEIPQILEKIRRGESIERLETTRLRKDGGIIPVSLTISPIWDEKRQIIGASTIARDISERRRAELEIVRLNTDLAQRAAELELANRDLEAFNYTVAHDLRQPLTVMNSYCQAIEMLCGDQLKKPCQEYVQGIYDATLRMNRLIEALLDFSSLSRVEPHRETVDLSALAHEVIRELMLAEPEREVEVRIDEEMVVTGDSSMLRVVLHNLLGNAWKYTGGSQKARIEFGLREDDGALTCYTRDNGMGFEQSHADQLFAPFQRLPGAEKFRGFGIGLATVERIIKRHGGKVWAEGEPGRGATFYFTLPLGGSFAE